MKQWATLLFLSLLTTVFADEEFFYCSCGTVSADPEYARAVFLLNVATNQAPSYYFPDAANEFYPDVQLRKDDDDNYPVDGILQWENGSGYWWEKSYILKSEKEDILYTTRGSRVQIPYTIIREFTWTDQPKPVRNGIRPEFEHRDRKVFDFQNDYGAIPQAFNILKSDIVIYYEKGEQFLDARIQDLSNGICIYEWGGIGLRKINKQTLLERKKKAKAKCQERCAIVDQREAEAFACCTKSLDLCIAKHRSSMARINRGLFHYLEGNVIDALAQLKAALNKINNEEFKEFQEKALQIKGQTELEAGLYSDAVLTLSELIKTNPTNKGAYFERAEAYFELGDFELSLSDYLSSEIKSKPVPVEALEMLSFSLGLTKGVLKGGAEGAIEYIPSLLSSLQGLGHGLWAFAQDPVPVSIELVQSVQSCVEFIRESTPKEALFKIVPELRELFEGWDQIDDGRKGEIVGHVIGKYGVDIFASVGAIKGMKLYRELKQANNLLTYEAMALNERNRSLIKLEAARKAQARQEVLGHANLKIQWDKQGKHIQGHRNFELGKNKSILEHPDPERLANDFCGKGIRESSTRPGTPGYHEVVNFEEFIGYSVNRETGEKIATTWGKIHYAKDGIHIVPTEPRW